MVTCGLVQAYSLTVPESVTVRSRSYMAKEWCAKAPPAPITQTLTISANSLAFIIFSASGQGLSCPLPIYAPLDILPHAVRLPYLECRRHLVRILACNLY